MRIRIVCCVFVFLTAQLFAAQTPPTPGTSSTYSKRILFCRPADVSAKQGQGLFFGALSTEYLQFRLSAISSCTVIPTQSVIAAYAPYANIAAEISDEEYSRIATSLKADYIIAQKCEVSNADKNVSFYLEISQVGHAGSTKSIERSFLLADAGQNLDSCMLSLTTILGTPILPQLERFFKMPVLSQDPKNLRTLGEIILADQYIHDTRNGDISTQYAALVALDVRMDLGYYLGAAAYMHEKKYRKAADYYKHLYDIIPEYFPIYFKLVNALRLGRDFTEAAEFGKTGLGRNPRSVELLAELAATYEAMGRNVNAEDAFRQMLTIDSHNLQALLFFAHTQNSRNKPEEAIAYADAVLNIDSTQSIAWTEKGNALFTQSKLAQAIPCLEKAIALDNNAPQPRLLLGDIFVTTKEYAKAATQFNAAALASPNDVDIQLKAANANSLAGEIPKAVLALKAVEGRFATNMVLKKELGLLELAKGDTTAAQAHLETALADQKSDFRLLMALGNIYTAKKSYDNALRMYNQSMPLITDKNACRIALANLALIQKDVPRAQSQLNEIAHNAPDYLKVNEFKGECALLGGNKSAALPLFLREREVHGTNRGLAQNITWLYFDAKNWKQTDIEARALLKIDPTNAEALFRFGTALMQLGNAPEGSSAIAKARQTAKPSAALAFEIGRGHAFVEQFDNAISCYRECLAALPQREDVWLELSDMLIATKQDSAAAEAYLHLFTFNPSLYKDKLADAGHIFNRLGNKTSARSAYILFLDTKFKNPQVNVNLASIEFGLKNYARVVELLQPLSDAELSEEAQIIAFAQSYISLGKFANAKAPIARILKRNPRHIKALELSALCSEKTNDLTTAITVNEQLVDIAPPEVSVNCAFHAGELYEKLGRRDEAIARYTKNIDKFPSDVRSFDRLAIIYCAAFDWTKAQPILQRALALPQVPPRLFNLLAQCYTSRSQTDSSIIWYQKYVTLAPTDSIAWERLGKAFFVSKDYKKCIAPLKMAVKFMPAHAESHIMLGTALLENNQYADASVSLLAASALKPTDTEILSLLASCYRNLKDKNSLITTLLLWAKLDVQSYDIRIELAGLLLGAGRYAESVPILQGAAAINPESPIVYKMLATASEFVADTKARGTYLAKALEYSPRDPDLLYQLGRFYQSGNEVTKAAASYKLAIDLSPTQSAARYEYGMILFAQQKMPESLEYLEAAMSLEPDNARYCAQYARVAIGFGNAQKALAAATKALEKSPKDFVVLSSTAMVFTAAGQTVKAKQILRSALEANEKCIDCYTALGEVNTIEANYKQAVKMLMRAWELAGYNEDIVFRLGCALSHDSKFIEAIDFFKMVLSKNPASDVTLYQLIYIYCHNGNIALAQTVLDAFERDQKKSYWTQAARGEVFLAQGNLDGAFLSLNVAIRLSPDDPHILDALGRTSLASRQYDQAIVNFGKAMASDPNNPNLLIGLAKAYEGQGNVDAALDLVAPLLSRFTENTEAFYTAACLKAKQGKHAEALALAKQGIGYTPLSSNLHIILGNELAATGLFHDAIEAYAQSLKLSNNTAIDTYRLIGDVYRVKLSNPSKAKEYYQKYLKSGGTNGEVKLLLKRL